MASDHGLTPGDDERQSPDSELPGEGPDTLPDIDRQIRINELKERARELAGGEADFGHVSPDLPPEIEEQFWERVVAFETADVTSASEQLQGIGIDLPEAEELDDSQIAEKLREIIGGLASLNVYLLHTDHLSDRELYETLVDEVLQEETPDLPMGMRDAWIF